MSDTTTPHYGLTKPENNGSDGTWGPKLNTDFDVIDTNLFAVSGVANGAATAAAAAQTTGNNALAKFTSIAGEMRNAAMSVTSASATATFAADQICVATALNGTQYLLSSYSQAINLGTTGAGGMDTGTAPPSSFVSLYAIYNTTTQTNSILACAAVTSSGTIYSGTHLPTGYTASALIGVWPTDSSSRFVQGIQRGRRVNVKSPVSPASLTNNSSFTSLSLAAFIPPNAISVGGWVESPTGAILGVNLAADANGTGEVGAFINVVTTFAPFPDIPIITPQTIFYKQTSTGTALFLPTGYSF